MTEQHEVSELGAGRVDRSRPLAPRVYVHAHAWGPWLLDAGRLCLCMVREGVTDPWNNIYEIDLEGVTGPYWFIGWLCQIRSKTWATPDTLGHLTAALVDLFEPRDTMDPRHPAGTPQQMLRLRVAR